MNALCRWKGPHKNRSELDFSSNCYINARVHTYTVIQWKLLAEGSIWMNTETHTQKQMNTLNVLWSLHGLTIFPIYLCFAPYFEHRFSSELWLYEAYNPYTQRQAVNYVKTNTKSVPILYFIYYMKRAREKMNPTAETIWCVCECGNNSSCQLYEI